VALIGPTGSGKTYSALKIATGLGGRIGLVDTENGSSEKYSDHFDFEVLKPPNFSPETYVDAIHVAEREGFDILIIDSLSHAWNGPGGALEMVDQAARRFKGNSYAGWRDVTPKHNALVHAMVNCKCHLIVTMRSKTAYEQDRDKNGKLQVRKIGLAPIQRDGVEYEFDLVCDIDADHVLCITKSRCFELADEVITKPGEEFGKRIGEWLSDGEPHVDPSESIFYPAFVVGSENLKGLPANAYGECVKELAVDGGHCNSVEEARSLLVEFFREAGFKPGSSGHMAAAYAWMITPTQGRVDPTTAMAELGVL